VQHSEDFRGQYHGLCFTPQAGMVWVQPKGTKNPLGGGHGKFPRPLA
jgi:hypothetical protein